MKKWLKRITLLLSVIVLVAIIGVALIVTFVSPNSFKPMLADEVKKATGRQLTIDGDISWTFFPTLGLKSGHLALSNPVGFPQKSFVEIDHVVIGVRLRPLLHAKIESTGISFSGVKLNLIKNANGQTNWQVLQTTTAQSDRARTSKAPLLLAIAGINITDSAVTWTDEQTKKYIAINNLEYMSKINPDTGAAALIDFKGQARMTPAQALRDIAEIRTRENLDPQHLVLLNDLEGYLKNKFSVYYTD